MNFKTNLISIVAIAAITFISCTQGEEIFTKDAQSYISDENFVTVDEAIKNADTFLRSLPAETRMTESPREVKEVIAYTLRDQSVIATRAQGDAYSLDAPLFYAINYKENRGFVLASADDRYVPIYAYVPEGNFEKSDIQESGFKDILNNLVSMVSNPNDSNLLKLNNETTETRTRPSAIGHKLVTKWGGGSPYNCKSFFSNVVSTAIALTQACAYFKYPSHIDYADYGDSVHVDIDWNAIRAESYANGRRLIYLDSCAQQVGHMMHFYEYAYNDVTLYNVHRSLTWMRRLGYSIPQAMMSVDNNGFDEYAHESLYDYDGVVFTVGFTQMDSSGNVSGGHSWIIDGFNDPFYHCNWGLDGAYDGLYQKSLFKPNNAQNFQYKLYVAPIMKYPDDWYE